MDKRVKKLWLKALRSGEYKQGKNFLRRNADGGNAKAYCCLGVLCELYRQQTEKGKWLDRVFKESANDLSSSELTKGVCRWSGLEAANPVLGRKLRASDLNDVGKSFKFIADRIEKYL